MQAEVNRLTKEKAVLEARERARVAAEVLSPILYAVHDYLICTNAVLALHT